MTTPADALRSLLRDFATEPDPDREQFTRRLRRALLDFGSETEDNRAAVGRVEFGDLRDMSPAVLGGLRLVGSGHPVAGILNAMEGEGVPGAVREAFPELDQEDFDAALRVAILCLSAFDHTKRD